MKTADFDYPLPAELIAQEPLADRSAARMLVLDRASGTIRHDQFRNLSRHLAAGDLLVLNNTKVIPARIWSARPVVELLLVDNLGANRWTAMVKPGHRAKIGRTLEFAPWLKAEVEAEAGFGGRVLRFTGNVESFLQHHGVPPLPPYIERPATLADRDRYQTVFAQQPGAVAAPTAGLHFTPELLAQLPHTFVTLHVGIGTFRPVKVEEIEQHKMHAERFSVGPEALKAIHGARRVIAVGTTVVRTLESIAPLPAATSEPITGSTQMFIRPGYRFQVVDALLTNFHLPKSTLLMLVSALAGRDLVLRAYAEAVRERYRFFSYGDCMLIV